MPFPSWPSLGPRGPTEDCVIQAVDGGMMDVGPAGWAARLDGKVGTMENRGKMGGNPGKMVV